MIPRRTHVARRRPAFTLVELLVVIVILAMLMGLVSVAVFKALRTGQDAQVTIEINQLAMGMNNYKDAHGAFPPSFAAYVTSGGTAPHNHYEAQIVRHLRQAFPRYTPAG